MPAGEILSSQDQTVMAVDCHPLLSTACMFIPGRRAFQFEDVEHSSKHTLCGYYTHLQNFPVKFPGQRQE